jgi:hypothetical protein
LHSIRRASVSTAVAASRPVADLDGTRRGGEHHQSMIERPDTAVPFCGRRSRRRIGRLDEPRRGARMQPALVADLDGSPRRGRGPGASEGSW